MKPSIAHLLRTNRLASLALLDSVAWAAAFYVASSLRLEAWHATASMTIANEHGLNPIGGLLVMSAVAIALHTTIAWRLRLHQGRSVIGGFEEMFLLCTVIAGVGVIVTTINILVPEPFVARTTPVAATCIAVIFCSWPRGIWRVLIQDPRPNRLEGSAQRVIVAGAGEAGRQLVRSMQREANHQWHPVGFVDDDRTKRHFRYRGVPVLGALSDIEKAAATSRATTIVIAMPSAGPETVSRIFQASRTAGLVVKVLPGIDSLLNGVDIRAIRDIVPEDFLGRQPIQTDIDSIAGELQGKRVLVTGAGGSIGSELCRQIAVFNPSELVMLDRDESALHTLALSLTGRADLESPNIVLANIRDADRVQEVFDTHRPEVVFHAAALKHVNMLERHASEAVKTNVLGTLNVLDAAVSIGVGRFVNISTDKAADPINVLGYSKRVAEGLTTAIASTGDGVFISVRFGNVLGTSGSVLKTFVAQIKAGGPVTVTHPDVTRYFMTVHEAVQLVIQAAAIGRDHEALVLDMGEPVKILDVAQQLIDREDNPVEIAFTGLKPGEKMHENLLGSGEVDRRPIHPLISHVHVPPATREEVSSLLDGRDNEQIVAALQALCDRMQVVPREVSSR